MGIFSSLVSADPADLLVAPELPIVDPDRCREIYEELAPQPEGEIVSHHARPTRESSYATRQDLLHEDHQLQTVEAYTRGEVPRDEQQMKQFLKDPKNWVPERVEKTKPIRQHFSEAAGKVSSALGGKKVLVLMRGNSGSGKSYLLKESKNSELEKLGLNKVVGKAELEDGFINPDNIKHHLQKLEGGRVSAQQVHEEGSMMADALIEEGLRSGNALVVDKRFGRVKQVEALSKRAKDLGYHVVVIDVDAPVAVSAERVAERIPGEGSPNVPFGPVAQGYQEARGDRTKIAGLSTVDDYFLFSSENGGGLVASRSHGEPLSIPSGKEPTWKKLTTPPEPHEIEAARLKWLDVLETMSEFPPDAWRKLIATRRRADDNKDAPFKWRLHVSPEDIAYWKKALEEGSLLDIDGLTIQAKLGTFYRQATYKVQMDRSGKVVLVNTATGAKTTLTEEAFQKLKKSIVVDSVFEHWVRDSIASVSQSMMRGLKDQAAHNNGTLAEHQRMAGSLEYYFKHVIPGVEIKTTYTAAGYDHGANARMELHNVDFDMIRRLLHDRYYQVEMFPDAKGKPVLVLETARLDPTNTQALTNTTEYQFWDERRHDDRDNGPGFNYPDYESPGSWGREFINYAHRLDVQADLAGSTQPRNFPDAPLAFEFKLGRSTRMDFGRVEDAKRYNRDGFWSHEASAVSSRVKLDLKRAKKLADQDAGYAQDLVLTALKDLKTSSELARFSLYFLKQSRNGGQGARVTYSPKQLAARHPGETTETALAKEYDLAEKHFETLLQENAKLQKEAETQLNRLGYRSH